MNWMIVLIFLIYSFPMGVFGANFIEENIANYNPPTLTPSNTECFELSLWRHTPSTTYKGFLLMLVGFA